jgi:hypothetical protein
MKKIKKFKKATKKPFIIALNDEIDKKVNEALMMDATNFPFACNHSGGLEIGSCRHESFRDYLGLMMRR